MTFNSDIAAQFADISNMGISGMLADGGGRKSFGPTTYWQYRITKQKPEEMGQPFQSKLLKVASRKENNAWTKTQTEHASANIVILYATYIREKAKAKGVIVCGSHDGINPSKRWDEPACAKASKSFVIETLKSFKSYSEAKMEGQLKVLLDNNDKLTKCGLTCSIGICPSAIKRVDPATGDKIPATCKRLLLLYCYDLETKTEFTIKLSGGDIIDYGDRRSYIYDFMDAIKSQNPRPPFFAFSVQLSPATDGKRGWAKFHDWKAIDDIGLFNELKEKAYNASVRHNKDAERLSKERYQQLKNSQEVQDGIQEVQKKVEATSPAAGLYSTITESDFDNMTLDDDDI